MRFLIVTPSFNQLDYLQRCVASVRDQAVPEAQRSVVSGQRSTPSSVFRPLSSESGSTIHVHHHVQDDFSTDGSVDWLTRYADEQPSFINYHFSFASEADSGMYDAVNRGWKRGAVNVDVLAYLNCDEQHLPFALKRVSVWFIEHPDVDVLFGDVIIADANGNYVCSRKMVRPTEGLIWTDHLPLFTASMFIRKSALEKYNLYPDKTWKNIGDVELVLRTMKQGVRIGILNEYLATFTDSGENLGLSPVAEEEYGKLRSMAPWWMQKLRRWWVLEHRLRKLFAWAYRLKPFEYAIYTDSVSERQTFRVETPAARWLSRLG